MQGWICLHRQILEWEWYSDINTRCLFIHCLLRANHADTRWKGHDIKRGQFITSLESLSKETGLTISQVRTSLRKLEMTSEVTSKPQAKSRMVTVVEYDSYQANRKQDDKQIASKSQASSQEDDREIATDNNDNNEDNVNNKELSVPENGTPRVKQAQVDFSVLGFSKEQIKELKRIRKANKGGSLSQRVVNSLAKEFDLAMQKGFSIDELLTEWEVRSWKSFKAEWIKQNPNQQQRFSQGTQQALQVISNLEYPGDD